MCLLTHLRFDTEENIDHEISEKGRRPGSPGRQRPPPVILRLKVADGNEASAAANRELVLQRRPLDKGGSSVDPEDDQCGLPHPLLLRPYVGITVGSARHYTVTFRSPVNTYRMMRDNVLKKADTEVTHDTTKTPKERLGCKIGYPIGIMF